MKILNKDQLIGFLILSASIIGIIVYGWLMFFAGAQLTLLTLQASAFLAVGAVLAILAWIGYTLATTPPPAPIEEIEKELSEETEKKSDNQANATS